MNPAPGLSAKIWPERSAVSALNAMAQKRSCIVIDAVAESRGALTSQLHMLGLRTRALRQSSELGDALADHIPQIVFVNATGTAVDALGTMLTLKQVSYPGLIQLIGDDQSQVLDYFSQLGSHFGLTMLPPIRKPAATSEIRMLLQKYRLGGPAIRPAHVNLQQALDEDRVEFWYQPKIDLANRKAVGAESFARIDHPEFGVLGPDAFMPDASDETLRELTRRAIVNALQMATRFATKGLLVRSEVNVSIDALAHLRVLDLVRKHGPSGTGPWPGLILDLSAEQLDSNVPLIRSVAASYAEAGVSFAMDDFGRGNGSLTNFKDVRFAEIKIDRPFTRSCAVDDGSRAICKTIVDLAHNFGARAVAIGVETKDVARTLQEMGCDVGQGFHFSAPLPEADFFALLCRKSGTVSDRAGAA